MNRGKPVDPGTVTVGEVIDVMGKNGWSGNCALNPAGSVGAAAIEEIGFGGDPESRSEEEYPDSSFEGSWGTRISGAAWFSSEIPESDTFSESSQLPSGDHLFSFFKRRRAFANQVETWVKLMPKFKR